MPRKKHTPEEIFANLRQTDVLVSQESPVSDMIREIGVTGVTFCQWRQECGGLKLDHLKRLKELELETARLRKAISDLTLYKLILKRRHREPKVRASETIDPRATPGVHRARSAGSVDFGAPGLCGARSALVETAQDPTRRREDEKRLMDSLVALVREHGCSSAHHTGWVFNDRWVERRLMVRHWSKDNCERRRQGLKAPIGPPKPGRLWPREGACNRLRAERPNHVWAYDFVKDRTHDRRKYRMLNVADEFTQKCVSIMITVSSSRQTSSMFCLTRSSFEACLSTSGRTMVLNSLRRRFRAGSPPLAPTLPNRAKESMGWRRTRKQSSRSFS